MTPQKTLRVTQAVALAVLLGGLLLVLDPSWTHAALFGVLTAGPCTAFIDARRNSKGE
jgi:hypothetical protein